MAKKALIVDDDIDIGTVVQHIMEREGYDVIRAYDGVEAVDKARSDHPDLVIMDIMMPRMDGIEALKILKDDASTSSIPVILLTAKDGDADVVNGWRTGAALYLKKPFVAVQLIAFIELILQGAEQ